MVHVPEAVKVTSAPLMVQDPAALRLALRPVDCPVVALVDDTATEYVPPLTGRSGLAEVNASVWAAGLAPTVFVTGAASRKLALPALLAVIVHTALPARVSVSSESSPDLVTAQSAVGLTDIE